MLKNNIKNIDNNDDKQKYFPANTQNAPNNKIPQNKKINFQEKFRKQTLINIFHIIKTATILLHPMTPNGAEKVLEYLNLSNDATEKFWSWDNIFDTLQTFCPNEDSHKLKFLPPRTDFFTRHPSQFETNED